MFPRHISSSLLLLAFHLNRLQPQDFCEQKSMPIVIVDLVAPVRTPQPSMSVYAGNNV